MSNVWTPKQERKLTKIMKGHAVMTGKLSWDISDLFPGRTPEGIRRHWLVMRARQRKAPGITVHDDLKTPPKPLFYGQSFGETFKELSRKIREELHGKGEHIDFLRGLGLRGTVTIDLGP
jgi:hypothetical protein